MPFCVYLIRSSTTLWFRRTLKTFHPENQAVRAFDRSAVWMSTARFVKSAIGSEAGDGPIEETGCRLARAATPVQSVATCRSP